MQAERQDSIQDNQATPQEGNDATDPNNETGTDADSPDTAENKESDHETPGNDTGNSNN